MVLPHSPTLKIQPLSKVFKKTSTTYKFHWFLAILETVDEGNFTPKKETLFIKMYGLVISSNYFHHSFGSQDKIHENSINIFYKREIPEDASRKDFEAALNEFWDYETGKLLFHFDKSVPHWFLSPWIDNKNKSEIYKKSQIFENDCLYSLGKDCIEINPLWKDYLKNNNSLLKSFAYKALAEYLQKKNPQFEIYSSEVSENKDESFYSIYK